MKKRCNWPLMLITISAFTFWLSPPTIAADAPSPASIKIADGEIDPGEWGKAYPAQYELWKQTGTPTPAGKSKYKKGLDADGITYDKLSEFPYMALLFNGWGFGIEYNEPQGHARMVSDQAIIDPSRVKAGGVCLTCKSPYAPRLEKEKGLDYYSKPWAEVRQMIPEKHQELGVACIDCHDNKDLSLKISRDFTLGKALEMIKKDPATLSRQEMRSIVCAQCHVTYNINKDADKKSVGVYFPWQGSGWGDISVENIIKQIRTDQTVGGEWTQTVTGYKMPFMRHPEFELFSRNSVHWLGGVACADCHMPQTKVGEATVSDHRVMSPLKNDLRACEQCHTETQEQLRTQIFTIQDRTVSQMVRSGNATAVAAKLIEKVHAAQASGKEIDKALYEKAKDFYMEAFLRSLFVGAENSIGFHNPTEAMRILGDSTAFAMKAEALLRQALTKAGFEVPIVVDLELAKYLDNRGAKKLMGQPAMEIKDPFGVQERLIGDKP